MNWIKINTWLPSIPIVVTNLMAIATVFYIVGYISESKGVTSTDIIRALILVSIVLWFLVLLIFLKRRRERTRTTRIEAQVKALADILKQESSLLEKNIGNKVTDELAKDIEKNIYNHLAHSKLSIEESKEQAEEQFNAISRKVEDMESRLPDKNSIAKINSKNDVLFFERIEQLSKKIEKIEEKTLTKWDVAIVCGGMFTGVFAIISVVAIVIQTLLA